MVALSREDKRSDHFDYYALAVSWAPQFCCRNPDRCVREDMNEGNSLTAHGLWPSRFDGTFPTNCKHEGSQQGKLSGRRKHEYRKHGSCSNLSAAMYFAIEDQLMQRPEIKALFNTINLSTKDIPLDTKDSKVPNSSIRVLPVEELHRAAKYKIGVKTSKLCQLEELTLCYEKTAAGLVGNQIDCTASVLALRNCTGCEMVVVESASDHREKCSFISKELHSSFLSKR